MSEVLRVGVVGLGQMGRNHARVVTEVDGIELAGVADPMGDPMGAARGAPVFDDPRRLIDQGIDMACNHLAMSLGTWTYPGIRQFFAVGTPQFDRGPQRQHGNHHHVDVIHVLWWHLRGRHLLNHKRGNGREADGILYDAVNVFVPAQDEGIGLGCQPLARQAMHRRLTVQDGIGVVPMLLSAAREQVYITNVLWALPTA